MYWANDPGPVIPKLLHSLTGGSMAQMSTVYGVMATLFAGIQLFAGQIQGALSDRLGGGRDSRSTLGLCITSVLMALAPSVGWLLAANIIWGPQQAVWARRFAAVSRTSPSRISARNVSAFSRPRSTRVARRLSHRWLHGRVRRPRAVLDGCPTWHVRLLYGFFVLPESLPRALQQLPSRVAFHASRRCDPEHMARPSDPEELAA